MAEGLLRRLGAVARDLNVGKGTIVDFLKDNGYADVNPNSKLDEKMYGILVGEFAADRKLKMEAEAKAELLQQRKDERMAASEDQQEAKEEVISVEASKVDGPKVLGSINLDDLTPAARKKKLEEAKAQEAKEAAEKAKAEKEAAAPPVKTKEQEDKEVIKAEASKEDGPKVLGSINLDDLTPAARKKKQEEAKAKKAQEAKEAAEKARVEKEAADKAAEEASKKAEADSVENQVIKANVEKLAGAKVLGKMELPVEKPRAKKPVATSNDSADKKRKRKRVRRPADGATTTPGLADRPRGTGAGAAAAAGRGGARAKRVPLTDEEIQKQIKETLARLSGNKTKSKGAKYRREKRQAIAERTEAQEEQSELEKKILKVTEFVTANELAIMMDVQVNEIIGACMSLGLFVSINQRLDAETLTIVAEEFGHEVEFVSAEVQDSILEDEDVEERMVTRPPIVTIMGHVDHGKTSLLDYIRDANVIKGEAGGITQHIGAYGVEFGDGKRIAFLDTPGHEAFTAMRARGAQVTDVVIIVIAADDSVMPQTKEAINHAQAAGVPMIFALNKMDKDGANPDKVMEELSQMNILVEDWGGKYQCEKISAKSGEGVESLLEKVVLEAEMLELKADPEKRAVGTIIESQLDKGRGYVSTMLVQGGTLRVGDVILAGSYSGKVKALYNERGLPINQAGPSMPAQVLGLDGAPSSGDLFNVMEDDKEARSVATRRLQLQREQGLRTKKHITLDEIGRRIAIGDFQELNLIVKGDVDGSIEALSDALLKLSTEKIAINIIMKGVGQITESDVLLASASDAIVIGFQVRPSVSARKLAEQEQIQIKLYSIIYDAMEEVKSAMEGMLAPEFEEKIVGNIEVRETFKITRVGTIAGCMVLDGKVGRNTKVRVIRDGIVVYTGELASLKRFKEDVKEVAKGYECGLNIDKYNDIKVGDIIEGYEIIEVKAKL
ncbi:MAG TPA: translation initiation factor IF-2 [Flavobacteriales bacterium]|nr:translation initiation factor IF-2 [Flavobacteriales bacterium]